MSPSFFAPLVLSVSSIAIEVTACALLFAAGRLLGYRHLLFFSLFAVSSAVFSTTNLAFPYPGTSDELVWVAGSVGGLAVSLASVSWLAYAQLRAGVPLGTRGFRIVAALSLTAGVLCLIPGLIYGDGIITSEATWLGVTYRLPQPTALASVAYACFLAPWVWSTRHVMDVGKRAGRVLHRVALGAVLFAGVNDALVSAGMIGNAYFLEVALMLMAVAVSAEMGQTLATNAARLRSLSTGLRVEVQQRTQQLMEARESLLNAEQLAAVGRLAAGVGHEINNPLTYVKSNLEYVLAGSEPLSAENRQALEEAKGGVVRIANIVADLRVLAQQSDGEDGVADLEVAMAEALRIVRSAETTTAMIEVNVPTQMVMGSPTRLVQVFTNLITNACHAVASKGSDGRITVSTSKSGPREVIVAVRDNGEGISPGALRRLFEPFFTTKGERGTGLGLSICRAIVESWGGNVAVDSEIGLGTSFSVTLRAVSAATESQAQRASESPRRTHEGLSQSRVLVVDDEPAVARAVARLLRPAAVTVAQSGAEARALLIDRALEVDAIVCDIALGDCTGIEVFDEVVAQRPELELAFVFMTGGAVDGRARTLLEGGGVRWMSKPIEAAELRMHVDAVVEVGRPAPRPTVVQVVDQDGHDRAEGLPTRRTH